jgi:hypothetical protein
MKRATLGTILGIGLVSAAAAVAQQGGEPVVQRSTPGASPIAAVAGAELIVVPTLLGDRGQMLTVVDPRQRVISVYHIDLATGKIALKSVRNIKWDLQMPYFNNEIPLPNEIRSGLEQR